MKSLNSVRQKLSPARPIPPTAVLQQYQQYLSSCPVSPSKNSLKVTLWLIRGCVCVTLRLNSPVTMGLNIGPLQSHRCWLALFLQYVTAKGSIPQPCLISILLRLVHLAFLLWNNSGRLPWKSGWCMNITEGIESQSHFHQKVICVWIGLLFSQALCALEHGF